jgi:ferredoxin
MPVKGWIEVNDLLCKGCEICVSDCPQHVLALDMDSLTAKGYHRLRDLRHRLPGGSPHRLPRSSNQSRKERHSINTGEWIGDHHGERIT